MESILENILTEVLNILYIYNRVEFYVFQKTKLFDFRYKIEQEYFYIDPGKQIRFSSIRYCNLITTPLIEIPMMFYFFALYTTE